MPSRRCDGLYLGAMADALGQEEENGRCVNPADDDADGEGGSLLAEGEATTERAGEYCDENGILLAAPIVSESDESLYLKRLSLLGEVELGDCGGREDNAGLDLWLWLPRVSALPT